MKQFCRFIVVGVLNTAVDLVSLNIMAGLFAVHDGWAFATIKSLSFLLAVTFSYFLNKSWTFNDKSNKQHIRKIFHFLVISVAGMMINVVAATDTVQKIFIPGKSAFNHQFNLKNQLFCKFTT